MSIYTECIQESQFIYYVYAYLRIDGSPYYIGKGCRNRAYKKNHNVNLPTDKSRIVFLETNLSEIGALALERRYIQWYGRKDNNTGILRNLTDGGEGVNGYKHTAKSIEKWAKTFIVKYLNDEPFEITNLKKFCEKNKLNMGNMSSVASGNKKHYKGWQVRYKVGDIEWINSNDFYSFYRGFYKILSPTNIEYFTSNLANFCLINKLDQSKMILVAKNKAKHHKGWQCRYENDLREWLNSNEFYPKRHYIIISPDGTKIFIENLRKFCRENNLNIGNMTLVAQKLKTHHKNWKCEYIN